MSDQQWTIQVCAECGASEPLTFDSGLRECDGAVHAMGEDGAPSTLEVAVVPTRQLVEMGRAFEAMAAERGRWAEERIIAVMEALEPGSMVSSAPIDVVKLAERVRGERDALRDAYEDRISRLRTALDIGMPARIALDADTDASVAMDALRAASPREDDRA